MSDFQELSFPQISPAPLLESLSIHLLGPEGDEDFGYMNSLRAGITPQLRHPSLNGCGVDLSTVTLTQWTILEIDNPSQSSEEGHSCQFSVGFHT